MLDCVTLIDPPGTNAWYSKALLFLIKGEGITLNPKFNIKNPKSNQSFAIKTL